MRNEDQKFYMAQQIPSIRILSVGLLPRIDPLRDPLAVRVHICILLAVQFYHDLFVECLPRFV